MDLKARLNKVLDKIKEGQGDRPILIVMPGEDISQKKQKFEKIHGKDYGIIIIRYGKPNSITQ